MCWGTRSRWMGHEVSPNRGRVDEGRAGATGGGRSEDDAPGNMNNANTYLSTQNLAINNAMRNNKSNSRSDSSRATIDYTHEDGHYQVSNVNCRFQTQVRFSAVKLIDWYSGVSGQQSWKLKTALIRMSSMSKKPLVLSYKNTEKLRV